MPKLDDDHLTVVRVANETLRAAAVEGVRSTYLCECGDLACIRSLELSVEEYDAKRLELDPRILHTFCAVREERAAVLDQNRLLRVSMRTKLERVRRGLDRLRRNLGGTGV